MREIKYFIFIILALSGFEAVGQMGTVQVRIVRPSQNQNFDGKLSDLMEIGNQLHATVQQVTGRETKRVNLLATLSNLDQTVQILARTNTAIELNGTVPYNLFGSNLTSFFDAGSIETTGIDRNDLITGGFVPEGFYKLCVVIFDADIADGYTSQLSATGVSGCITLKAQYAEPPRITTIGGSPVIGLSENVAVPVVPMPFVVQWSPAVVAGSGVTYKLQIADMGDIEQNPQLNELDPNIAFDNNPYLLVEKDGIAGTSLTVGIGGQLNVELESSHRYAIRVQARTLTSGTIKNNGYSEVVGFWFGETGGGANAKSASTTVAITAYPEQGYMPFLGMPVTVRLGNDFDPDKTNIKYFRSDFSIEGEGGGTVVKKQRDLDWSSGSTPRRIQEYHINHPKGKASVTLTSEQARRIAISHASDERQVYSDFYIKNMTRGRTYSWNADINLTEKVKEKNVDIVQNISGSFIFGMDKPLPQFPENKSQQEKGTILFKYQTSSPHDISSIMLYDIVQAKNGVKGSFDVSVSEKAILEVSTSGDFSKVDSIKFRSAPVVLKRQLLSANVENEKINWEEQLAFLYKEEQATFDFTKDGTYYWRIKWLKNPESETDTTSYNSSEIWQFTIGDEPVPENTSLFERPPIAEVECENCETVVLPTGSTKPIKIGDFVKVGHFVMEVSEIAGSAGGPYSGKATMLDFSLMGFSARLNVSFSDLRAVGYTADGKNYLQATSGKVETVSRGAELLTLVELINDQPLSLPLGVDFTMSGHHIVLELDKITFLPTKATAMARAAWEPPLDIADGQPFAVSAREVCLLPGRFGNEATFVLDQNIMVNQGSAYEFSFTGDPSGSNYTNATFLQFKCDTVSVQLAGQLSFPRSVLLPENGRGKIIEGADKVSGLFKLRIDRYAHIEKINEPAETETGMIAQIGFSGPFQIAGLDGWGFTATNASLDLSDIANPNNMRFPNGYVFEPWFPANSPPSMQHLWRGVYCKDLLVRIPKDLTQHDDDDESAQFGIEHLIIDKTGVSVSIDGENVLALGGAKWDFTIDEIALAVVQTKTFTGTLNGRLRLPNFDPGSFLDYNMMVTTLDNKPAYSCNIRVKDDPLKMSLWLLDVKLDESSYINFEVGRREPGKRGLRLKGELNGYLGIQPNPVMDKLDDLMDLKLADVKFEKFGFDTDSSGFFTFSHINWTERAGEANPVMAFASPQHSAGRLPISITGFDFVNEGGKPGLKIGAELNLSDVGFKAAMGMTIFGNMETNGVIPSNVSYDHIRLDTIRVNGAFAGFNLRGEIVYYNTEGDKGYKGNIAVTMPMGVSGKLTAQFGSRGATTDANYFRYWFVDGMVYLRDGIPISPALDLRGFGGGAWYHMKLDNPNAMSREAAALKAQEIMNDGEDYDPKDVPPSGLKFSADRSAGLGMSIAAVFALQGDETVFNMDVAVQVAFSPSWGLVSAGIIGNGYLLQDLDKRDNPSLKATVDLRYTHNEGEWVFTGDLDVMVDMASVLVGAHSNNMAGHAQLYFDHSGKWFFKLGEMRPNKRIALKALMGSMELNMNAYVMVGHEIPNELPPLPDFIQNLLSGPTGDKEKLTGGILTGSLNRGNRAGEQEKYKSGKGIALGTHMDFQKSTSFLFFYADLHLAIGADINFSKPQSIVTCSNADGGQRGFSGGWYAQGQAYAGFDATFGIEIDLWIFSGRKEIASVGAAIGMQIQLPNPTYLEGRAGLRYSILGGRVKGQCNYHIEVGEKCDGGGAPLGDIQFISEISPETGSTDVSPGVKINTVFNFPMNEEFEIEEQKDGDIYVRTFVPFISKYVVSQNGVSGNLDAESSLQRDNLLGILTPATYLAGKKQHKAYVEVQANETTGSTVVLVKNPQTGEPYNEHRETTFRTGPLPKTIVLEDTETWPIVGQRFFLQNVGMEPESFEFENQEATSVGKMGYFKTRQDGLFKNTDEGRYKANVVYRENVGPATAAPIGREVSYAAVFTPSDGPVFRKNVTFHDLEKGGPAIDFNIPDLLNSTTYRLDIVRYIRGEGGPLMTAETGNVRAIKAVEKTATFKNGKGDVSATVETRINKFDGPAGVSTADPPEFVLASYVFRTSKFNNHREKLSSVISQDLGMGEQTTWKLDSEEPFEVGDFPVSIEEARNGSEDPNKKILIQMRLGNWSGLTNGNTFHPKFKKYNNIYNAYKSFATGFTKYFTHTQWYSLGVNNYPVTSSNLADAMEPLQQTNYLDLSSESGHRIKTFARVPPINTSGEENAVMFRYPYFVQSFTLMNRIPQPVTVRNRGGLSIGVGTHANSVTATGSGAAQGTTQMGVGNTASHVFENAGISMGSGGGAPQPTGGVTTLIRDKTNAFMRQKVESMTTRLNNFKAKVPETKRILISGLYQIAVIKPLTDQEWQSMALFFSLVQDRPFSDWNAQPVPYEPFYGGTGLQPIEFIYWVPTWKGSYPTQPLRKSGTQYLR